MDHTIDTAVGVGVAVESEYEVKRVDLDYFVQDEGDATATGGTG